MKRARRLMNRLLGIHSPSEGALGACWCQSARRARPRSYTDTFFDPSLIRQPETKGDGYITVTARRADTGEAVEATISPAGPALSYDEYWTGPAPWWKRALRRLTRRGRR